MGNVISMRLYRVKKKLSDLRNKITTKKDLLVMLLFLFVAGVISGVLPVLEPAMTIITTFLITMYTITMILESIINPRIKPRR